MRQRSVQWLLDNVDVDSHWCLVHATHLTDDGRRGLAGGAVAGVCPITEANQAMASSVAFATSPTRRSGSVPTATYNRCCAGVGSGLLPAASRWRPQPPRDERLNRTIAVPAAVGGAAAAGAGYRVGSRLDAVTLQLDHPSLCASDDGTRSTLDIRRSRNAIGT